MDDPPAMHFQIDALEEAAPERAAVETRGLTKRFGSVAALEAAAVADPHTTVRADVERRLATSSLSPEVSVPGHVYDVETGRITTELDARHPQPAGNN